MTSAPGRIKDAGADFVRSEAAGGIVLIAATVIALIWANVGTPDGYFDFWENELTLGFGNLSITEDLQHWVNDALMAIFFFVVGLEIKRELVVGELNDRRKATLPILAAFGGVLLPGAIYVALNAGGPDLDGWAIPMATDIAFAIAIMAMFRDRLPSGVRLFLLTIAIVDDLIAITVIAIFYTGDLELVWLLAALAGIAVILLMRTLGVNRALLYIPAGVLVWLGFFESGIHATIAGVVLGLLTPARPFKGREVTSDLEHVLHPWSAMLIVPLFALANAGLVFNLDVFREALGSSLFWGIAAGLVVGKFLGIGLTTAVVSRTRLGDLPEGVTDRHVWGVAALGGIGFTVSLFITGLAFDDNAVIEKAKLGIFAGSLVSAAFGSLLLLRSGRTGRG